MPLVQLERPTANTCRYGEPSILEALLRKSTVDIYLVYYRMRPILTDIFLDVCL